MKIEVTAEHIKNGTQCSSDSCPIALAIVDTLGLGEYFVSGDFIAALRNGREYAWTVSSEVKAFVGQFDYDRNVQPFSFELGVGD